MRVTGFRKLTLEGVVCRRVTCEGVSGARVSHVNAKGVGGSYMGVCLVQEYHT